MIGERFRVERRLGRGGMASVYLAYDEDLDRPVALKLLESLAGDGCRRTKSSTSAGRRAPASSTPTTAVSCTGT
jgi:serine/threonine-protein kinase